MARELYDFAGRYGAHRGKLWEDLSDFVKDEYRKEAQFLVDEFIKKAGYFQEEAEWLGKLQDEGWIPPSQAKHYAKLAKDQSLPKPKEEQNYSPDELNAYAHYVAGWNNGLNKAKRLGWRKVVLEAKDVS